MLTDELPDAAAEIAAAPDDSALPVEAPASEVAPEPETAPEAAPISEAAAEVAAETVTASGIDPALVIEKMTEVVTELEAIAATADVDAEGKHPDDRALTERLRTLEETWRTLAVSQVQEPDLRARQQAARASYAAARSRRAEMRAVERARAGETKRALLVEAFALSQLAQGTSLSQLAGRVVGDERPASRRGKKAAAATEAPVAVDASAESAAPAAEDAVLPSEPIADDVVAADATLADTSLSLEADAAEEAALEPVDVTLVDETAPSVPAETVESGTVEPETVDAAETAVAAGAAEPDAATETAEAAPSAEAADPTIDPVAEIAAADEPTDAETGASAVPEEAAPVTTTTTTIDISAIARRARELQNEWNAAGFAGREVENELQPLFRRYMQLVFDLSRKESNEKSDARRALVTAARALAEKAGDDVTSPQIAGLIREAKALQSQWKSGEAAPPAVESGAWRQFSGALRQIFVARDRLAAGAKEEREQIIAAIEALAGAREPMRAMRDLGPLLRRWRESGPVTTPVFEQLKVKLDRAAATIRDRADSERKRRDAEDAKSSAERSKNASKIIREAQRSGGNRRQERPAAQAQAQGALAAALAEAFGRAEGVAAEVRELEKTVAEVRERLRLAEAGDLSATTEEVETQQGFTVRRTTIDAGAVNPARLKAELAQAEQALARRQSELKELTTNARGYGLTG